jgi:hypothetical protein
MPGLFQQPAKPRLWRGETVGRPLTKVGTASARGNPDDHVQLGREFQAFAAEYREASPLYERLAEGASRDPEVLALASRTQPGQPAAHLLLAAVHLLLLRGEHHPLARFYPTVTGTEVPAEDPYPAFRAFCLEHAETIKRIVAEGLVQTNEPRRCSALVPALQFIAQSTRGRPLALIEIGASAGLNLLLDRYGYDYGSGLRCGDPASPVQISCQLRGTRRPPIPDPSRSLFPLAARIGIDVAPVDVRDHEQALWLQALVWPDEKGRADLLDQALELARADPPRVLGGDALERLPEALAAVGPQALPCVVDFFTLQQLEPEARARLTDLLAGWADESGRQLFHVSIEGGPQHGPPQLKLASTTDGLNPEAARLLAHCDRHGAWLEWLAGG